MEVCKHLVESQEHAAHLYSIAESLGSEGDPLLGSSLWQQLRKVPGYSFLASYAALFWQDCKRLFSRIKPDFSGVSTHRLAVLE